jgi:transcription elongation GreA/GreB family factor
MSSLKVQLHQLCLDKLNQSIESLSLAREQARAAQQEETKSSAGDKFETTREMMTQEIEKNSAQIAEHVADRNRLMAIGCGETKGAVQQGSLVNTNRGNFYLAVSLGVIECDGIKYQTISSSSPIGRQMLNKKKGERFLFRDKEYLIEDVQ